MRDKLLSVFIFLFILIATLACSPDIPGIKVDGDMYKFGEILEGKDVIFAFVFMNTGKKDLVIEDQEVSCFCVNIRSIDKVTKPGQKGKVYGFIKTDGFQGNISKSIKLKTNIPNTEPVILTIEGKITPRKK
jgi:hypothetical protein